MFLPSSTTWSPTLRWVPQWYSSLPLPLSQPSIQADIVFTEATWPGPLVVDCVNTDYTLNEFTETKQGYYFSVNNQLRNIEFVGNWVLNSNQFNFDPVLPEYLHFIPWNENIDSVRIYTNLPTEENLSIEKAVNWYDLLFSGQTKYIKYGEGIIVGRIGLCTENTTTIDNRSYCLNPQRDPTKPVWAKLESNKLAIIHPQEIGNDGLLPINTTEVIICLSYTAWGNITIRVNGQRLTAEPLEVMGKEELAEITWQAHIEPKNNSTLIPLLNKFVQTNNKKGAEAGIGIALNTYSAGTYSFGDVVDTTNQINQSRFQLLNVDIENNKIFVEPVTYYYPDKNLTISGADSNIKQLRDVIITRDIMRSNILRTKSTDYLHSEVEIINTTHLEHRFKWKPSKDFYKMKGTSFDS